MASNSASPSLAGALSDQPMSRDTSTSCRCSSRHSRMFNADRQLKFPFTGPVTEDVGWPWKAFAASLLAFFPMLWFGIRFGRFKLMGRLFFMALISWPAA